MEKETIPDNFEEEAFNLKAFLYGYLRYWYVYVLAITIGLSCAYFYNWYSKPVYGISAKILIKDDKTTKIGAQELLKEFDVHNSRKSVDNEMEILKSRKVLQTALEQIEIDVKYYLVGNVKESEIYTRSPFKVEYDSLNFFAYTNFFNIKIIDGSKYLLSFKIKQTEEIYKKEYTFGDKVSSPVGTFTVNKRIHFDDDLFGDAKYAKRNFKIRFTNISHAVDIYRSRLQLLQASKRSSIIILSIEDQLPQRGIDFLNTLIRIYSENDIVEKNKIASYTSTFISDQISTISNDLKVIETKKQYFKMDKGLTDVSTQSGLILESVKLADNQLSKINLQLNFVNYLQKYLYENRDIRDIAPASPGIEDPLFHRLINSLTDLEIEQQKLKLSAKSENALLKSIDQQISYTRDKLLQNIGSIKKGLIVSENNASNLLVDLEQKLLSIPETEKELIGIEREYRIKENMYIYLLQKEAETSLALAASISDNQIIEHAHATSHPIRPLPNKSYSLALLLGLLVPTGLIFLVKLLDDKVRDSKFIEKITKMPILGIVRWEDNDNDLIVTENPKSSRAESYRTIRTNLKYFSNQDQKVILVTSSVASEGKTYTAINLASIISASGNKTILLGLDLRKPKIKEAFKTNDITGISSFLAGVSNYEEIIQNTEANNLDIIPSGPIPPNPTELILNFRMKELMKKLKDTYDTIIIDSPPVGLVSDGLLLTDYADVTIFVVRQNITKKRDLENVAELYRDGKLNNASIIFNGVNNGADSYGYGYYYDDDERKGFLKRIFNRF